MDLHLFGLFIIFIIFKGSDSQGTRQPQCERRSCYPATGDLLIGRQDNLTASSTCGKQRPEVYCIVSHLEEETKCFECDSRERWTERNRNSHRIENIVSSFRERKLRWWQAENGKEQVYVQLDLEAEFHFTHLIMTFKTFRPRAMLIERSYDFGKTWKVYRYFAYDCQTSFPGVKLWPPQSLDDVICENKYSDKIPSTEGEVIFRVLPPIFRINDPYSEAVQDLLKLTNLRVNFTELHTLGDTLLDSRGQIKEKYYYAMYDMTVRGSCSCYGHASRCVPVEGYNNRPDMVHGQCECTHNTQGRNCEKCMDFYNDLPWKPASPNHPNECQICNCNNHATRCHFDPSVFEQSGKVSGGVCDNCQHNTMGKNCQECLPFFYQDPNRDIRDPDICQACDCDPHGSEFEGQCDGFTNEAYGMVAGRCTCKRYVEGKRCDTCQENYWNLQENNPYGCELCDCNVMGTVDGIGCDQENGRCFCKRYVTGQKCDQCHQGYYGLSDAITGCTPCDCDLGGATSDVCNMTTGQCSCKSNIIGKQCTEPRPEYFFARLDYLLYEAELARGTGNTRLYIREVPKDRPQSWTGSGYMQVTEGDSIEFTVDNIDFPMYYDIVIRYDPRMPERWENVRVTVVRPGEVDQNGPCANHIPSEDQKTTSFNPGSRHVVVTPPACLEPGVIYTIRLDFDSYSNEVTTLRATTLIDSIVLVPNTDSIPIFQPIGFPMYMKNEFIRYRCREAQLNVYQPELPEFCRKLTFSISSVINSGAIACQCDPTGSTSSECEQVGGQCPCKPNVVGRRCDRCAPGTYDFGPDGCKPCNCHEFGSRDNFCDPRSGQCLCINNVAGRACDRCESGNWGFPQCRPCECNGNADVCEDLTGRCIGCRDFTGGDHCELCADGYYGDPRINYRIPCQPCMCPGGPTSEIQHADSCYNDPRVQQIICNCYPGFQGPSCDRCTDNYYGNPLQVNGTCQPCTCNNNIDVDVPSCDTSTGECLRCLYNTEGFNCERCRPGYFGDATQQSCSECICYQLGTDAKAGPCDHETGQCPCLPNVVGTRCERCEVGYWNITSGTGCASCGCDPEGSLSVECNQFDGQCECIAGRGGRDCSQCEDFYWGDPTDQCYPCDCNRQGSSQMQCDRQTGQCVCLTGISGYKCDRCDRGTTGELPNCVPCGECFDNWDRVIRDLRGQTESLIEEAKNIKSSGTEKVFDKEFRQMEDSIREIREIIATAGITSTDLQDIDNMLQNLRLNLTDNFRNLDRTEKELDGRMDRIRQGNNDIRALKKSVEELRRKAEELRQNATDIQARDVGGAFNLTRDAQMKSRQAQRIVDGTQGTLDNSASTRQQVEDMLAQNMDEFNRRIQENENNLNNIDNKVNGLGSQIADLNEMVCDGRGDPCDYQCGGAGCGRCGGISCDDGAVYKAENALDLAEKAEKTLEMKEKDANNLLGEIQNAQSEAESAKDDAQMAYNAAQRAKDETENARTELEDLLNRIGDFLGVTGAKPEDIKAVADEVLAMSISLTPDQIIDLAQQINQTVQGLQNIDSILNATSSDLAKAQRLKERAETAESAANDILNKAEEVLKNLAGATDAQNKAEAAINQADNDIRDAESDLTQNATQLVNVYAATSGQLNSKYDLTSEAENRAKKLKERADRIAGETTAKLKNLQEMQARFSSNEKRLTKLSLDIDELNRKMTQYLQAIQDKAQEYYTCKT
ncbi:hypothetical protein KUTeg_020290 [Tegillarca granosa]|uniref:Laminin subunit beta-1 n=1 Tax=Tegillarca granosa TaxID=220873 RepID=A0ABQ9EDF1_TEGGR|nr:hypothetical protein KUTeg_020290 [Tegillarca granosa]